MLKCEIGIFVISCLLIQLMNIECRCIEDYRCLKVDLNSDFIPGRGRTVVYKLNDFFNLTCDASKCLSDNESYVLELKFIPQPLDATTSSIKSLLRHTGPLYYNISAMNYEDAGYYTCNLPACQQFFKSTDVIVAEKPKPSYATCHGYGYVNITCDLAPSGHDLWKQNEVIIQGSRYILAVYYVHPLDNVPILAGYYSSPYNFTALMSPYGHQINLTNLPSIKMTKNDTIIINVHVCNFLGWSNTSKAMSRMDIETPRFTVNKSTTSRSLTYYVTKSVNVAYNYLLSCNCTNGSINRMDCDLPNCSTDVCNIQFTNDYNIRKVSEVTLNNLIPFTNYLCNLTVRPMCKGNAISELFNVTTQESAPESKPDILRGIFSLVNRAETFCFYMLMENRKLNGIIRGYIINFANTSHDRFVCFTKASSSRFIYYDIQAYTINRNYSSPANHKIVIPKEILDTPEVYVMCGKDNHTITWENSPKLSNFNHYSTLVMCKSFTKANICNETERIDLDKGSNVFVLNGIDCSYNYSFAIINYGEKNSEEIHSKLKWSTCKYPTHSTNNPVGQQKTSRTKSTDDFVTGVRRSYFNDVLDIKFKIKHVDCETPDVKLTNNVKIYYVRICTTYKCNDLSKERRYGENEVYIHAKLLINVKYNISVFIDPSFINILQDVRNYSVTGTAASYFVLYAVLILMGFTVLCTGTTFLVRFLCKRCARPSNDHANHLEPDDNSIKSDIPVIRPPVYNGPSSYPDGTTNFYSEEIRATMIVS